MYLDNSATTKVSDEVLEEMLPYLKDEFGNPSTLYSIGRESTQSNMFPLPLFNIIINIGDNEYILLIYIAFS